MDTSISQQPRILVNDTEQLNQLVSSWLQLPQLALDTEFMRTQTYYPLPALIQVNDGQANYLLDPLLITDLSSFATLLASPDVIKVLHACSEDLEVFQHLCGQLPVNLFDTQIAGALLGQGFSVGYGRLVEQVLGIKLPKDETRSDWLQRPLTEAQQHYAALDVEYLLILAETLQQQLHALDRTNWVQQDCVQLLQHYQDNQNPHHSHLRLKSTWKMNRREQTLVQHLCYWRELNAQTQNLPRNHLLKEASIYALAELKPKHISQLHAVDGLQDKFIRRNGQALIEIIANTLALPEERLSASLERPLSSTQNQQVKQLRGWIEALAEQLNVAPEMLARKKDYEYLVRTSDINNEAPSILQGWRRELVGLPLLAIQP